MVIVIGGMISLGKTTIAKMLADDLGSKVFYESVDDNKILPLFYKASEEEIERKRYPFLLQLWFLNTRFKSIKTALQDKNNVLDRSIYEDWYFAKVNHDLGRISDLEMEIYNNLLNNMMEEIKGMPKKAPDLMVYLKASFDTVIRHINLRGRNYELGDELVSYYKKLWQGYDQWVYNSYKASDVITIDMDRYDVVKSEDDKKEVLKLIKDKLNTIRE